MIFFYVTHFKTEWYFIFDTECQTRLSHVCSIDDPVRNSLQAFVDYEYNDQPWRNCWLWWQFLKLWWQFLSLSTYLKIPNIKFLLPIEAKFLRMFEIVIECFRYGIQSKWSQHIYLYIFFQMKKIDVGEGKNLKQNWNFLSLQNF